MQPLPERDLIEVAERARSFWPSLHGKQLLLTGMTGPFGLWVLSMLGFLERTVGLACSITLISRDPARFLAMHPQFRSSRSITWVQGDIRDVDLHQTPFDYVVHGAATRADETFQGQPATQKFDTVVRGTERLLSQLPVGAGTRLLFLSSGSVYGTSLLPTGALIPEVWPEAPQLTIGAALGHAKRAAEYVALASQENRPDLSVSVSRCFSFVGPALPTDIHYAMGNFLAASLENRDIVVTTSGTARRSYLYMGDMVAWLLASLVAGQRDAVYHIGSENGIPIRDLAVLVRDVTGSTSRIVIKGDDHSEPGTSASRDYIPDTQFTREVLGVAEWTTLAEGIQRSAYFLQGVSQGRRPRDLPDF